MGEGKPGDAENTHRVTPEEAVGAIKIRDYETLNRFADDLKEMSQPDQLKAVAKLGAVAEDDRYRNRSQSGVYVDSLVSHKGGIPKLVDLTITNIDFEPTDLSNPHHVRQARGISSMDLVSPPEGEHIDRVKELDKKAAPWILARNVIILADHLDAVKKAEESDAGKSEGKTNFTELNEKISKNVVAELMSAMNTHVKDSNLRNYIGAKLNELTLSKPSGYDGDPTLEPGNNIGSSYLFVDGAIAEWDMKFDLPKELVDKYFDAQARVMKR